MWVFSTLGFFSAVCVKANGGVDTETIMVRARKLSHLESLRSRFSLSVLIVALPNADYRYRIIIDKTTWSYIAAQLASDIDYPNFKNAVARLGRDEYDQALHEVWAIMASLQK